MVVGSPGNENRNPATEEIRAIDADMEKQVAEAFGNISMEDLMAEAMARAPGAGAAGLQTDRPVRGGRPRSSDVAQQPQQAVSSVRRGTIIALREGNAFVDIGGKSQGIVPLEQFDEAVEGEELRPVEVGQEYDFVFKGYDSREGLVMLARQGAINHAGFEHLSEGDIVEAEVTAANKGGLECKVNRARAFMPAGQVDIKFNQDLNGFVGQRLKCQVAQIDRSTRNVILSRRVILEQEALVQRDKTWQELSVGQIREGTVKSVQAFGAFVDLGAVDGLVHISEMSHTRVSDPSKLVKPGDKVQVMVLNVDREKQRISLGLKQLSKDPWKSAAEDFPVGTTVGGTVRGITDFGAFIELAPGVEGMVHISQLSAKRIGRVSEVVQVGQQVQAKVLSVDAQKKKISLSMAEAQREGQAAVEGENAPAHAAAPQHAAIGVRAAAGLGIGAAASAKPGAAQAGHPEKSAKMLKGGL